MGWFFWLVGIALAVIVGLSVFDVYSTPYVVPQITAISQGAVKALLIAVGLVALAKVL
jgi:hypothetical protein